MRASCSCTAISPGRSVAPRAGPSTRVSPDRIRVRRSPPCWERGASALRGRDGCASTPPETPGRATSPATASRPSSSPRTSTSTSGRPWQGCLFDEDEHTHQWLFEGVATYLSWQALLHEGGAKRADLAENLRYYGAERGDLAPLRAHEREGGGDRLYARWHLAVRSLASRATGHDRSLLRFCRAVARRTPWRRAFAESFGVGVEPFYAAFERSRR